MWKVWQLEQQLIARCLCFGDFLVEFYTPLQMCIVRVTPLWPGCPNHEQREQKDEVGVWGLEVQPLNDPFDLGIFPRAETLPALGADRNL